MSNKKIELNEVNTDLSTWDDQFKQAIQNGMHPDNNLFEGIANNFDKTEW